MRTALFDLRTTEERACPAGHAQVLCCHPLRFAGGRPRPFPTLYWLACPELDRQLSELERTGWIARIQQRIARDVALKRRVAADHRAYIDERWRRLSAGEREAVRDHGLEETLRRRGIGGILDFKSVKCLHLHYAHRLAADNVIGELIEREGLLRPCGSP
jgi:hypothetical protein